MNFNLFPYCQIINGNPNPVILNLQKGSYTIIPNDLFKILTTKKNNFSYDIEHLILKYGNKEIIESYFDFLVKNQIGIYSSHKLSFQPINKNWEFPGLVRSMIISINDNTTYDVLKVINRCIDLGCINLELRLNIKNGSLYLEKILENIKSTSLTNITCFIKGVDSIVTYEKLADSYNKLTKIVLFNCDKPSNIKDNSILIFSKEDYNENRNGFITNKYFIDINFYLESLRYNPFLNKKVYISPEGYVKNDSYYEDKFGNINEIELEDIIKLPTFQYLWKVNNDHIEELKDNPMRYSILNTGIIKIDKENNHSIMQ